MKYTSQRGTKDILPSETPVWQAIEDASREVFHLYNYAEIRTPVFEQTELFARSIGTDTDIVSKEMYTFEDKGGRSLTLRPEETAPVVRAALQHNLISNENLTKLYYIGPMFRYERPQAGRYRQFHQAGVEAFGSADPLLDVEVIEMAVQLFDRLGLKDLEVDINSVGCKKCRPEFLKKLKAYFQEHIRSICEDCQKRLGTNTLRILDCKNPNCQKYILKAPATVDALCGECKTQFESVLKGLKSLNVKYRTNDRLVRGLDYYTGTTFEVVSKVLGAQNAVCGGGRYDNLVEELGGKSIPAVGFAVGIERLVEVVGAAGAAQVRPVRELDIFIAPIGDEAKQIGRDLIAKIRQAGFSCEMDYLNKKLKSQLKTADNLKARFTLIMGEDEIKKQKVVLRDMQKASQEEIACDAATIAARLGPKK